MSQANTNNKVTEIVAFYDVIAIDARSRQSDVTALGNVTSGLLADVNNVQATLNGLQPLSNEELDELRANIDELSARAQETVEEVRHQIIVCFCQAILKNTNLLFK